MKTIYKYPLTISSEQAIKLPIGAKFCHIGLDPQGVPCLWYMVDKNERKVDHRFYIYGTGFEINAQDISYLGSFVKDSFVGHVFAEMIY